MKLAGYLLLGLMTLGLIAAAAKVVLIVILCLLLLALIFNPRETFGLLTGLAFLGLLGQFPVPMIILCIGLIVFAITERRGR